MALDRVSFAVQPGEIFGLLGALVHYGRRTGSSHVGQAGLQYALIMGVMGFIMPQREIPKGLPQKWRASISIIEKRARVKLPLPARFHEEPLTWPADLPKWRSRKSEVCRGAATR